MFLHKSESPESFSLLHALLFHLGFVSPVLSVLGSGRLSRVVDLIRGNPSCPPCHTYRNLAWGILGIAPGG